MFGIWSIVHTLCVLFDLVVRLASVLLTVPVCHALATVGSISANLRLLLCAYYISRCVQLGASVKLQTFAVDNNAMVFCQMGADSLRPGM